MVERYSPHRPLDVRRQSASNYEDLNFGYAQKRRALYRYEVPPNELGQREPYSIWEDIAEHLDLPSGQRFIDFGANDGYFNQILRNKGFDGEYIGVDIEDGGLPTIEYIARLKHPNSRFIQGDAQDLLGLVETSSADRAAAVFLGYHVAKPGKMLSELHRVLTPDGLAAVASRDPENQLDIWSAARHIALNHGFVFPQEINPKTNEYIPQIPTDWLSVYAHFNISQTKQALSTSKKFIIIYQHIHDSKLWVPINDEAAIDDIEGAIESLLPYTVRLKSDLPLFDAGRRPTRDDIERMSHMVHTLWRYFIKESATRTQEEMGLPEPYYVSQAKQGFFIVKAIKK